MTQHQNVLAGVQTVVSKGKTYHYHRKAKKRLSASPTPAEVAEIDAWLQPAPAVPQLGTLGALMSSYRAADVFLDLKPATRKSYRQIMRVLEPIDRLPLERLTAVYTASVRDTLNKKHGRRTANYALAVLSVVAKYGIETGTMTVNPTTGVRRVKNNPTTGKANRPWSAAERRAFLEHAPAAVARIVALAMCTGLRRTDLCVLPRSALVDGFIVRRTSKTGQEVRLPVHPDLAALLAAAPAHKAATLVATSRGTPWTPDGFSTSFMRTRDKLEKMGLVEPGLTIHGLRHTVGTLLRGCTDDLDLIRRWLGQKTLHMAVHYSSTADTSDAFLAALGRFDPLG